MFEVHKLNAQGMARAKQLQKLFEQFLLDVEQTIDTDPYQASKNGRELALVRTKLQEASFFAKRAMSLLPGNTEKPE